VLYDWYVTISRKQAYLLSWVCLSIGQFIYFAADVNKQIGLVIFGRFVFGIGGARLLTRQFITKEIDIRAKTKYSAWMVCLSSLGMTLGPFINSLL
jgi:MFS family permease